MKAIITVGCSASGKSTFAKDLIDQGWVDVNRDDIRFDKYCFGVRDWDLYKFSKEKENNVTVQQERMVDAAHIKGQNIIISDTNINDKTRNFWINRLSNMGYDVEVKYFDVDLMELLARDTKRDNGVGYKVITDQYARYMKLRHGDNYHKHSDDLPHVILVDIDGTVAEMQDRKPYDWGRVSEDLPRKHIIDLVTSYRFPDYDTPNRSVIFLSGRDAVCQKATRQWLIDNVGWAEDCYLFMRGKGDTRKDTIVKKELFDKYIKGRYNVDYVVDDRDQVVRMWEFELGLSVIKVGKIHNEF